MTDPRPRLVMTLLVRDEADIVGANVAWHLSQGVAHVIAMDNASTDGTVEALRPFERKGVLTLLREPSTAYLQDVWATRMAAMARDALGADWVFCNDADEFWRSPTGDLRDMLPGPGEEAGMLVCRRHNMIASRDALGTGPWSDVLAYRADPAPPLPVTEKTEAALLAPPPEAPYFYHALPPKLMLRTRDLRSVGRGGHSALYDGPEPARLPCPVSIFHFPLRGRAMFERSVVRIGRAIRSDPSIPLGVSWKYRRWLAMTEATGSIWPAYRETLPDRARLSADLEAGRVVRDPTMARALRRLDVPAPEPAASAPPVRDAGADGHLILIAGPPAGGGANLAALLGLRGATRARRHLVRASVEPDRLGALQMAILAENGLGPDDPRRIPASWFDGPAALVHRQTLFEFLIADFADLDAALVSDPALGRLLPLWRAMAENHGLEIDVLIPVRPPLAVARDLRAARGLPITAGLALWLRHLLDAERDSRGARRTFVFHDDLLADWRGGLLAIERAVGASWPQAHSAPDAELDAVVAGLRGNGGPSEAEMIASPQVPDAVKDVWEILAALRRGVDADETGPAFDRISALLDAAGDLLGPIRQTAWNGRDPARGAAGPKMRADRRDPWDAPSERRDGTGTQPTPRDETARPATTGPDAGSLGQIFRWLRRPNS